MGKRTNKAFKVATTPWRLAIKSNVAVANGVMHLGEKAGFDTPLAKSQKQFFTKPSPKAAATYTKESVTSAKTVAKLAAKFV